jgi:hypothetical protein
MPQSFRHHRREQGNLPREGQKHPKKDRGFASVHVDRPEPDASQLQTIFNWQNVSLVF